MFFFVFYLFFPYFSLFATCGRWSLSPVSFSAYVAHYRNVSYVIIYTRTSSGGVSLRTCFRSQGAWAVLHHSIARITSTPTAADAAAIPLYNACTSHPLQPCFLCPLRSSVSFLVCLSGCFCTCALVSWHPVNGFDDGLVTMVTRPQSPQLMRRSRHHWFTSSCAACSRQPSSDTRLSLPAARLRWAASLDQRGQPTQRYLEKEARGHRHGSPFVILKGWRTTVDCKHGSVACWMREWTQFHC